MEFFIIINKTIPGFFNNIMIENEKLKLFMLKELV